MARQRLPQGASVDFDEEEAPAPAPRQALPQGAAVEFDDEPEPNTPPAPAGGGPSVVESGIRGGVQELTMNFSDEVVGLGKALFSKDLLKPASEGRQAFAQRYRSGRDEEREANRIAQETNPTAYGIGQVVGGVGSSFIPGLGIAKGAGLLKTAVGAGKLGAISGLGRSESEDIGGQLADAGMSGLVSAGTAGLLKGVMDRAPKRAIERRLGDVTDGATATMRDRVVGKAGDRVDSVLPILREKGFSKAGRDPGKLLEAAEEALQDTGQRLDDAYATAGSKSPGILATDVLEAVESIAKKTAKDPGKADLARAVQGKAEDIRAAWIPDAALGTERVTAQQVRVLASDIADAAFRGSPAVAPKQGQAVSQQVWGALKDLIGKNLDEAGVGSKEVQALNKRMSNLMNIREAVRYRATREATESTRLKDRISGGLDLGLALAEPSAFVAKKAYDFVGKPAVRYADDKLAQLVTAAQNGSTKAQVIERAIMLGFSPVVARSLASWAHGAARNLTGEDQTAAAGP